MKDLPEITASDYKGVVIFYDKGIIYDISAFFLQKTENFSNI